MSEATEILQVGGTPVYILPKQKYILDGGREETWARVRVPMPPSVNQRQTLGMIRPRSPSSKSWLSPRGRRVIPVIRLTPIARQYLENAWPLNIAWRRVRNAPYTSYVTMRFYFFLPDLRYDTHNGLKLACDLIERSGMVTNDRLVLPHIMTPVVAKDEPRLIVEFPL